MGFDLQKNSLAARPAQLFQIHTKYPRDQRQNEGNSKNKCAKALRRVRGTGLGICVLFVFFYTPYVNQGKGAMLTQRPVSFPHRKKEAGADLVDIWQHAAPGH
eukprot:1148576-Pelagomonas_calceolata.AAC.3